MIDRVELVVLDEPQQVRHLDRHHALGRKQRLHAADEVVQIRHVRHHVVGDQQVRPAALGHQPGCQLAAEELHDRVDPSLLRHRGHVGGGLDAERRDAALDNVLQQIAVVAGELHHEAVGTQSEALDRHLHILARVVDPGVRVRREVRVLGEDVLGGDELLELDQQAALADAGRAAGRRAPSRQGAPPARSSRTAATCRGRRTCDAGAPRRSDKWAGPPGRTRPSLRAGVSMFMSCVSVFMSRSTNVPSPFVLAHRL